MHLHGHGEEGEEEEDADVRARRTHGEETRVDGRCTPPKVARDAFRYTAAGGLAHDLPRSIASAARADC